MITDAIREQAGAGVRHVNQCQCDETAEASSGRTSGVAEGAARDEQVDRHHHRGHHGHFGDGSGYGPFPMGLGRFIGGQLRAARREVAGEQMTEAVAGLTTKVAEVIGAAGQPSGLDAAQESFTSALQNVVDRFESGDIGRRGALDGFRAVFEDLVSAVRTGPENAAPAAGEAATAAATAGDVTDETDTGTEATAGDAAEEVDTATEAAAQPAATTDTEVSVAQAAGTGGTLVENLGQAFNSFLQGLKSDFSLLGGMRSVMSPDNRDMIYQAFVDLYRELADQNGQTADPTADPAGIDQMV